MLFACCCCSCRNLTESARIRRPIFDVVSNVLVSFSLDVVGVVVGYLVCPLPKARAEPKQLTLFATGCDELTYVLGHSYGIAIDHSNSNVWVTRYNLNRVQAFSDDGKYLFDAKAEPDDTGKLGWSLPTGLAFFTDKRVLVCDGQADCIVVCRADDGRFIRKIELEDDKQPQVEGTPTPALFEFPWDVAVAIDKHPTDTKDTKDTSEQGQGLVYVTDCWHQRVVVLRLCESDSVTVERTWGTKGTEDGQLREPKGIALSANGDVVVVDNCHRVQVCSRTHTQIHAHITAVVVVLQFAHSPGFCLCCRYSMHMAGSFVESESVVNKRGNSISLTAWLSTAPTTFTCAMMKTNACKCSIGKALS